MNRCLTWTRGSEEDTRGKGRWDPSKQKTSGREGARPKAQPRSTRAPRLPPSAARSLRRLCDCCFAAFLIGRPLLTPDLRAANLGPEPRVLPDGQFRVAVLLERRRHGASHRRVCGLSGALRRDFSRAAPGLAPAELRRPMGTLVPPTSLVTGQIPAPLPGGGAAGLAEKGKAKAGGARVAAQQL